MKIGLFVCLGLFVIACCLPALEFKHSNSPDSAMMGLNILVVGWSGIFAGVMAWYANPFWALGLIFGFFRKPVVAMIAGIVAILIASSTFSVIDQELPADEGNVTKMSVIRLLPGCYIWMASLVALPLAALFQRIFVRAMR